MSVCLSACLLSVMSVCQPIHCHVCMLFIMSLCLSVCLSANLLSVISVYLIFRHVSTFACLSKLIFCLSVQESTHLYACIFVHKCVTIPPFSFQERTVPLLNFISVSLSLRSSPVSPYLAYTIALVVLFVFRKNKILTRVTFFCPCFHANISTLASLIKHSSSFRIIKAASSVRASISHKLSNFSGFAETFMYENVRFAVALFIPSPTSACAQSSTFYNRFVLKLNRD